MKISILDAQRTLFEGIVSEAILPGSGGELSLLDEHEPIFVALTQGYIRLTPVVRKIAVRAGPSKETESKKTIPPILIHQGLARMKNNELVVLVE